MACKRCRSNAASKLLNASENINFLNPSARKIDMKMLTKHLCEKDEHAHIDFELNPLQDSEDSDNILMSHLNDSSDENSSDNLALHSSSCCTKSPKKRKVRPGTHDIAEFEGRKLKTKHRYSSWFLLYAEKADLTDKNFLKDFRRRFRLPYCKCKESSNHLKNNMFFSR